MEIRLATTEEELETVYRLRYEIYFEEMGRRQRHANHTLRRIEDPLDAFARVLVAWHNGAPVGTVRNNLLREGGIGEYHSMYEFERIPPAAYHACSITTRLIVSSAYRSGPLALRLAKAVYKLGPENGVQTDLIDCNPPLDVPFERLGHRKFSEALRHPEYGDVVVMKLDLVDRDHLQEIRSPFLPILAEWQSQGVRQWALAS